MPHTLALSMMAILAVAPVSAQAGRVALSSPNGRLEITFQTVLEGEPTADGGQLVYSVAFQGKPLIDESVLALELQGQRPLGAEVRMVDMTTSETDETHRLVTGKTSVVRDRYNALRIDLKDNGRMLAIEARAYDDAIAFRYVIPEQPLFGSLRLTQEKTEFRVSKDATTYALVLPHYRSMYESEFVKVPISGFSNQGGVASEVLLGLPLLMDVPGVAWLAITEANLKGYAGMYLVNPSGSWTGHWFESRLSPHPSEPGVTVAGSLPRHSAWRVLLIGEQPGRFIESNVITSLNPKSAIADTSWIRAGRAAWGWWSDNLNEDGESEFTTENMKYYVDFAARNGIEYVQVDAGWSALDDIVAMNGRVDIPELVRYAEPKGVKIWIWLYWSAVANQMEEAFPLYEKWGVAGLKIDFMSRDDQEMIDYYYRVAEKAAEHRLMVDFHGSSKPWGMERTWPNVLGYEGVLGMEQSKAGARDNPDSHVTLPFTRMLAGPMDYTPGGFDNVAREEFVPRMQNPVVMGTRAHHLAMYAIFESPFQMVSDHPSAYEGEPSFEFISNVPATWDETRVIHGDPGEYVTIARRRGEEWFLGSMTNWTPRTLDISLDFLGSGRYIATIYADATDADRLPKKVVIERLEVDRATVLDASLAAGGGYAVRLVPEDG